MFETLKAGVVLVVVVAACTDTAPPVEAGSRDSSGVRIVTHTSLASTESWSIEDEPTVQIDGETTVALDQITGLAVLSDGIVVVGDGGTKRLHAFDEAGQHLWSTGGEGEGPGEFRRISSVFVAPGDTILVVDTWPSTYRLSVFSGEGRFVRVERLNSQGRTPVALLSNGDLLYRRSSLGGAPPDGALRYDALWSVANLAGDSLRLLATSPGADTYFLRASGMVIQIDPPFGREPRVAPGARGFFLSPGGEPRVDRYDFEGQVVSSIRFPSVVRQVADEDLRAFRQWYLNRYPEEARPAWRSRLADVPSPEQWPAVGDLLVDDQERLWVQTYQPPWVPELHWHVFSDTGEYLGEARGPGGISPRSVRDSILYGVCKDSFDVQSVCGYRITRAPAS